MLIGNGVLTRILSNPRTGCNIVRCDFWLLGRAPLIKKSNLFCALRISLLVCKAADADGNEATIFSRRSLLLFGSSDKR